MLNTISLLFKLSSNGVKFTRIVSRTWSHKCSQIILWHKVLWFRNKWNI